MITFKDCTGVVGGVVSRHLGKVPAIQHSISDFWHDITYDESSMAPLESGEAIGLLPELLGDPFDYLYDEVSESNH